MIVKPYTKANNGSWHYEVQFLGAVEPQPTEYYITCTTPQGEQLGFATQGFFRPVRWLCAVVRARCLSDSRAHVSLVLQYTPPQITAGWYKRPGTWVISFFFVLFAGGWLYLFASVKWNEIPDIPPPGDSEDEESDDSGSEYDSGSDGSGSSGVSSVPGPPVSVDSTTSLTRVCACAYLYDDRVGAGPSMIRMTMPHHRLRTLTHMLRHRGTRTASADHTPWGARQRTLRWIRGHVCCGQCACACVCARIRLTVLLCAQASIPPPPPAAVAGAGTFVAHCPNCGEGNPDPKATFCSKCGQPMR